LICCIVARCSPYLKVAKVGGLQSQGAEGEAVVGYCEHSATPDMEPSGFPLDKNALCDGIESISASRIFKVHCIKRGPIGQ